MDSSRPHFVCPRNPQDPSTLGMICSSPNTISQISECEGDRDLVGRRVGNRTRQPQPQPNARRNAESNSNGDNDDRHN
jgi:hypothetical protein